MSGTRYLHEAFLWVVREGAWGSEVHALLQPPADEQYSIESARWPIRVSYPDAAQQAYAEMVLEAAERSYDVQVDQLGFYQPVMEAGYEPYRVSLGSTGSGVAGYTAPYDTNPDTAHADCFTYIVINPNLGESAISTTAHEFNHAMQASMDCAEVTTYWENTSTFIEGVTYPEYEAWQWGMMQFFQREPWRALDYFDSGGGYQYGGVLWNYYLAHAMGVADAVDAGIMVREIWEAAMQESFLNEPDYYDAIEVVAAARGVEDPTMEALYTDFAEARYFVTSSDDGQHIARAGEFHSAEVAMVAEHETYMLPVRNQKPPAAMLPAPYGSNHIVVSLPEGWTREIMVGFSGEHTTRWAVRAVLVGQGEHEVTDSRVVELNKNNGSQGSLTVDPTGYRKLVLVVVNLGLEDYDPDDEHWPRGEYSYRIEPVVDPPVIQAIYPAAVLRGQQQLRVRLVGQGFVYGQEFDIQFTDPLLQVEQIDAVSETEVLFTLTVPASTNAGLHNLTVVNAGGASVTAERFLAVVDTIGPPDPRPEEGGCQTAASGPAGAALPLLTVLLVLLWAARRRS